MDVTEEAPLLGLAERGAAPELDRPPDVVQECCGDQGDQSVHVGILDSRSGT